MKYHPVWPRARQLETVSHGAKTKVSPGRWICLSQSKAVSWGQSSVQIEFRSPWWLRHTVEWGTELPGGLSYPTFTPSSMQAPLGAFFGLRGHTRPPHLIPSQSLAPTLGSSCPKPHRTVQQAVPPSSPGSVHRPACLCLECVLFLPLPPQWPDTLLLIWVHSSPNEWAAVLELREQR